jgi:hypothetical protein
MIAIIMMVKLIQIVQHNFLNLGALKIIQIICDTFLHFLDPRLPHMTFGDISATLSPPCCVTWHFFFSKRRFY